MGKMKLSTKYGLAGIGALTLLSLVHRCRELHFEGPDIFVFLLGVLPNLTAAIAIPFVLLSIWADRTPAATHQSARRQFSLLTLFAGIGLILWEFLQRSSHLVFDYYDIASTIIGLIIAWILFALITPITRPE